MIGSKAQAIVLERNAGASTTTLVRRRCRPGRWASPLTAT